MVTPGQQPNGMSVFGLPVCQDVESKSFVADVTASTPQHSSWKCKEVLKLLFKYSFHPANIQAIFYTNEFLIGNEILLQVLYYYSADALKYAYFHSH